MENGTVLAIFIRHIAGAPMQLVNEATALAGQGLMGDAYSRGEGSYSQGKVGRRQVTLINGAFFPGSAFNHADSRRNIVTDGVELMRFIGYEFRIGGVLMRGVKYCEPCDRPSRISGNKESFEKTFFDRGGIIAEILKTGPIRVGDLVVPPPKGY